MTTPRILVLHIMKTAGTSLRRVVEEGVGSDDVYPNDHDLSALPQGWYRGARDLLADEQEGRTHGARVLIGHLPYVFAECLEPRPLVVALLREPVARTISIMEHRRRTSPALSDAPYEELLELEDFVETQVRDYQTKMFAFDSIDECPDHVNVPLPVDDERFRRALTRLESVDVLGLTEDLPSFIRRLDAVAGLGTRRQRRDNRGRYQAPSVSPAVLDRIRELTARDHLLYERARELAPRRQPWWRRAPGMLVPGRHGDADAAAR